jgi:hypothetical protein
MLGAGFTYQGQLRDGAGSPVDDTCDFTFSLWDAVMGGSQVGSDSVVTGVEVSEGHFAAVVNDGGEFGEDAFTGQPRWLEIAVQCSGDPGPTPLSPRQLLSAAPYALSLRPGAVISGAVSGGSSLTVINDDPTGRAVYGFATGTGGWSVGVYGETDATTGTGVTGWASATSGTVEGVYGVTASTEGSGVYGYAGATEGESYGVFGRADSSAGRGVYGYASASSGSSYGVFGVSDSTAGTGIYGTAILYGVQGEAALCGVYGVSTATLGQGVYGHASAGSGYTYGVSGQSDSTSGRGVYGNASATSGTTYGVYGRSISTSGRALYGFAEANSGTTYGVYGRVDSPDGYGGYFVGDVHVQGDLSASGTKPFKIDHPLDPANRYLYHYSVESPEVLNQYSGNVILDENGEGWVELPSWFETLNREFRYQLTPIGASAPNLYVAQEIQDNRFQVAGGPPGIKVSWEVTALRDDPYIQHYGAPVEVDKPAGERGTYLCPELYGQPDELGLDCDHGGSGLGLLGPTGEDTAVRVSEDVP